ncbi:putative ribonuclease H-like domain-containing protein [Tanacetum coccineum]
MTSLNYPIWEVIQRGNGPVSVSTDTNGVIKVLPPKTTEEILARERERKERTTLLMALPEDHLAKFHKMTNAKEMWEAIKSRFGGNDESKKMQKYILKQQFEGFSESNSEGLHKGYDRVFESDVKGSTTSSSSTQNVAFVSKNTSSTNEVSTVYGVSSSSGHNPQKEGSSSYTDELMYSFFANQYSGPQLDHEDLEQLDEFDLEEMDLKWQVAMISMRLKKFYKKTGIKLQFDAKEPVGFDKTKVECYNCHKTGHFARECRSKGNQDSRRRDAWNTGNKAKDNERRFGKQEEPKSLVTLDGDGSDTKMIKLLAEAEKEKEELKAKVEKWHNSSKSLNILLNSQMSARDKVVLGYGVQMNKGVLSYENEVFGSLFYSRSSDIEDSPVNDRYAEGMHAVPPPMTGIYIPSGPDKEIDESQFTYGPKQSKPSESDARSSDFNSCESNSSEETLESMPEPVVNEPKVVSQPKVWSDAPIIEEYESDSDDDCVTTTSKEQEQPSFAFINTVKHVKTPRQTVKEQNTCSQSPKPDKKDCSGLMSKKLGLGYGFTKKACFASVEQYAKCESPKPIVPTAVLTRTGRIQVNTARASSANNVNTARHNFNSQAVPTNAARKVNTVKPIMNYVRRKTIFHKTHSPLRRPFNRTTTPRTNFLNQKVNTAEVKAVSAVGEKSKLLLSPQHVVFGDPKDITGTKSTNTMVDQILENDYPQRALKNKWIVDSGCFRHMTGNKAYLAEYQYYNGGTVAFGGSKGYITGKGKIKIGKLDFEDVCFVKELQHFNLFSVSQMCDKKNKVLFTDTECLVLSPDFRLTDENQVLLRVPRQNNMYSFNLENIVPSGGKQHKASCKAKSVSSISQPLQLLHMDLFGPTSVRSINHKTYCLVITDDFSRFSWVFFLRTKDETSGILKDFIRQIENQLNQKVKTIRCDNGTEFKNRDFIEYSNARTPQQNGVAKRKNKTLIEAARTMLADSFLPNTFWAEAVSTACYVLNRVLVTKPQNKTPYELITGKIPIISYIRPFGCHVTILNTIDHLGKFDGKSNEGFLVGYSLNSKDFRVYNLETKKVEENLYITFLENKPNVAGKGPNWLFNLDYLTNSMNYQPVRSENQAIKHVGPKEANHSAGTQDNIDVGNSEIEVESAQDYFVLPIWSSYTSTVKSSEAKNEGEKPNKNTDLKKNEKPVDQEDQKGVSQDTEDLLLQAGAARASSTNTVNTASTPVSTASPSCGLSYTDLTNTDQDDSQIPTLEDIYDNPNDGTFTNASYDDKGAVADFTNFETIMNVSPIPTSRIHSIHPSTQILGDPKSAVQTRSKVNKSSEAHAFVSYIQKHRRNNHKDLQHCLFACFLSQIEPKKISEALEDESWVDAMQEELLQFKIQKVTLKTSHLNVVKRIFRYLKGKPKLGLWYPRVSSFDLKSYSDSDYVGANLDRKSTTGGCQFLGMRLISWQCKKQTIGATSTTEAEYVAAANCCGQNPVFHFKTKHIEIRHHFIRDSYEKKLIQAALVKGRQDDLLYSLYGMFCEQKNLDNGDVFHRVIWVLESNWREL